MLLCLYNAVIHKYTLSKKRKRKIIHNYIFFFLLSLRKVSSFLFKNKKKLRVKSSTSEPFLDHAEVEFDELGTTFLSLFIFRTIIIIVTKTKVTVEMTANKIMILQVNYTWQ